MSKRSKPALNLPLPNQYLRQLQRLNTPQKVQDFVNTLRVNFEPGGDTLMSPAETLRAGHGHCIEAALVAALAFWLQGQPPMLLDLRSDSGDMDHVVALFKQQGLWGAVSRTNHAVLRYREPVYKTVRELALSYFHEYFLDDGRKTLRDFSKPFDLRRYKNKSWIASKNNLWFIAKDLDKSPHQKIASAAAIKNFRRADQIEIAAGKLIAEKRPVLKKVRVSAKKPIKTKKR